ncbi:MAG: Group II intron-encoded protein LtrA [Chroococcidiopsis sp. SAG 2025]|uniref:group II intron reverse transcriptase/maturase n=1 Tax=Chroococcidiopsis sp. SAG 2025 TaxID=171389 RepID=UPI002937134C|nr:group II intron reverse transcriptase/maturase [Chroococcidiopsis sp. SAG 2025]MDV2997022.1 Group II intron-encoded protein LtrA [Chroococcidiopsis sp. SAG 2025]MDV2997546.1 Group II intron-encoded protein LtrA [Chroococcidiopsis sp. SAG 2025]
MCQCIEVQVATHMPNSNSRMKIEGWRDINWRKAERYVFRLQKRIYAASRRGDVKRVRKLQNTLMRSWYNKVLAVRRVTQDNTGKKTAGVDGVKSLSPEARLKLARELKLTGESMPTRRVWIPKPGKGEKRPLGIPRMYDRALQAVVKTALEPEWEALFEPNSYGFRPGRSAHDAIKQIKYCIQLKPKYVLDADIAKCFDRINHETLLQKLNVKGRVRQQIKAWLKSGVIDSGVFISTSEGTPQGGVISPLLANIALHGIEEHIAQAFPATKRNYIKGCRRDYGRNDVSIPNVIRYADDFVVLCDEKAVVQRCRELISEWLKGVGLELKPEKTRLTHTLNHELSEDGIAGFDFLGHHIRQFPAGKYRSSKDSQGNKSGYNTLIFPSKKSIKAHQEEIKRIVRKHGSSPQAKLIKDLNPVIRGWTSFYTTSDAKTAGELSKQDYLLYLKLRRWAKRRCGNTSSGSRKYWTTIAGKNWAFVTKGKNDPQRLLRHSEFSCSSTNYVKVKNDKSPYDGDSVYWSTRMGTHPQMPSRKAYLLKKQKGKCARCGLHFQEWDVFEVDHIIPRALGGKDEWKNRQLLHRHCHHEKTNEDRIGANGQKFCSDKENTLSSRVL